MKNLFFDRLTKESVHYAAFTLLKWFNSIKYSDRHLMIFPKSDTSKQERSGAAGDSENLLIYKTKYDERFQKVNISNIIRTEIDNTIKKTKDPVLKEFLEKSRPIVCFTKNDNLSNILVRADIKHYTK